MAISTRPGPRGPRLQRVAGQPSLTIKIDGWLPRRRRSDWPESYARMKTVSERTVRRLCADSRRRQQLEEISDVCR